MVRRGDGLGGVLKSLLSVSDNPDATSGCWCHQNGRSFIHHRDSDVSARLGAFSGRRGGRPSVNRRLRLSIIWDVVLGNRNYGERDRGNEVEMCGMDVHAGSAGLPHARVRSRPVTVMLADTSCRDSAEIRPESDLAPRKQAIFTAPSGPILPPVTASTISSHTQFVHYLPPGFWPIRSGMFVVWLSSSRVQAQAVGRPGSRSGTYVCCKYRVKHYLTLTSESQQVSV
ncbi:hypothetical protein J6590_025609 [Homalodisca vitripennis]|nr:hypothetical protein J6590_025609 [Homalodisca vitripennis]